MDNKNTPIDQFRNIASPSSIEIELKHEINHDRENLYHTQCGVIDRRCIEYGVKVTVCIIVLVFSLVKVLISRGKENNEVWIALISSILGNFLPAVSLNKQLQKNEEKK